MHLKLLYVQVILQCYVITKIMIMIDRRNSNRNYHINNLYITSHEILQSQAHTSQPTYANIMKLVQSFLGFKQKKSVILEQRNSLLKLLLILNIPSIIIIYLFNAFVSIPYMDEIFHYPQFKQFLEGNHEFWDPKITTPPGLYHAQVYIISKIFGSSLLGMRMGNWVVFGNIFTIFALKIYEFQDHNRNNSSRTLNLILTPTIFFFFFLDYTDSASIAFLTMALYYTLVKSTWRMGICSLLSVYMRQNNIIWVAYFLVYRCIADYQENIMSFRGNLFRQLILFISLMLRNLKSIITYNIGQIMVLPVFFYYLHQYNEGKILFGDHQSHQLVFHPTQVLYLFVFMVANLPITLGDFIYSLKETINRIYYSRHAFAAYLFTLAACLIIVDKFTFVHKFILSDNRHYIFYIYRYLKWGKFLFCGLYAFCIILISRIVLLTKIDLAKFLLWLTATVFYLGPSELVEFRYFTAPYVLLMFELKNRQLSIDVQKIHGKSQDKKVSWQNRMIWGTLIKIAINIFVFYMFLFKTFGENKQSRFMW